MSSFGTDIPTKIMSLFVFKCQVGAHDYLGMQVVPLNTLVPYEKQDITLDLQNSMDPNDPYNKTPRGQIMLETTFVPFLEDSKKFSTSSGSSGNGSSRTGQESMSLSGTGLLLVNVVEAKDVEGKRNSSNPYAMVLFRGDKRRTKVRFFHHSHFNICLAQLMYNIQMCKYAMHHL